MHPEGAVHRHVHAISIWRVTHFLVSKVLCFSIFNLKKTKQWTLN